jgi:DNA-binding NarL/FixJ family response regulator
LLLVDDDDAIRLLLQVTAEFDERFELVAAARSGQELMAALDEAGADHVDAVVVDVTLPDRDGIELVAELREQLPNAAIALFTGWSDPELDERARVAGADCVFTKTTDTRKLFDELVALSD